MSERKTTDQLTSEPVVGDLGYAADGYSAHQTMIARVMLRLQLLADEVDEITSRINGLGAPIEREAPVASATPVLNNSVVETDLQLGELTEQIRKLTKTLKKANKDSKRGSTRK